MRLITKQVPMNFNIFQISCTHWGSSFHHEAGWEDFVKLFQSRYRETSRSANYLIHHGDMIEAIEIGDKRWSLKGIEPGGIIPQVARAVRMMNPIKKQVITILQGNHEDKLEARYGNVTGWVCKYLDVPYGTYSAVIQYVSEDTGKLLFKQYATHGHRGITSTADDIHRRNANRELILKRQLKFKMADCYVMSKGHTHQTVVVRPDPALQTYSDKNGIHQRYTATEQNTSNIPEDLRWYINVGAYYKLYYSDVVNYDVEKPFEGARSSYAEKAEYDPIDLGFVVTVVRDGKVVDMVKEIL